MTDMVPNNIDEVIDMLVELMNEEANNNNTVIKCEFKGWNHIFIQYIMNFFRRGGCDVEVKCENLTNPLEPNKRYLIIDFSIMIDEYNKMEK